MKLIASLFLSLIVLFCVIIVDSITYDTKEKYTNIQKVAYVVRYSNISTQFKSKEYQEFVYAK